MLLSTLKKYLDEELNIEQFAGDSSLNGLQVEGAGKVARATLAVDACNLSIRKAVANRSQILIVHHGLFWGGPVPVTGILRKRLALLLKNHLSLYAAHLPLDCHPRIGNNARLADMLKLEKAETFGNYKGLDLGIMGLLPRPITPSGFARKTGKLLSSRAEVFPFGGKKISRLAIVSGGGASLALQAARAGCDALLTGEPAHSAYHPAREAGISLICGGHYATETVGIKALGELISSNFGMETVFVDIPTGL